MTDESVSSGLARWVKAWPDALAFAGGLALAWFGDWQTKDLVWSLWLSSLLIGYAMIVWDIFGMPISASNPAGGTPPVNSDMLGGGLVIGGRLFLLAFFTVHFGGFHFVHAAFLNGFFPVEPGRTGFPNPHLFLTVLSNYWPFLLVTAVAERRAFRHRPSIPLNAGLMAPYKNVVRLHLLIFFFAFTSIIHLHNFAVYAVVYAVYFFPWRLVKRDARATNSE